MTKSILDQLDEAEKAATPGPWPSYWDEDIASQIRVNGLIRPIIPQSDAELIALMRNNIRILIDVARAAENYVKRTKECAHATVYHCARCNIKQAFTKLNGGGE